MCKKTWESKLELPSITVNNHKHPINIIEIITKNHKHPISPLAIGEVDCGHCSEFSASGTASSISAAPMVSMDRVAGAMKTLLIFLRTFQEEVWARFSPAMQCCKMLQMVTLAWHEIPHFENHRKSICGFEILPEATCGVKLLEQA